MDWILPGIIAASCGTFILFLVYLYLYILEEKDYLGIWALAWGVYFLRFIFQIVIVTQGRSPLFFVLNQWTSFANGALLLWGSYRYIGEKVRLWQLIVFCVGSLWIIFSHLFDFTFTALTIPAFFIQGAVYFFVGILFLRHLAYRGLSSGKLVGITFILWGIHKIDYPFLYPITWLAPYGFMLGALLGLVVSIGIILVYFQRTRKDLLSVSQRLRESEEQMCSIMASMNEGVVLQNADGKIVFSNNKALQIFKMTAEEMVGRSSLSEGFHMVYEDGTPYPVERHPAVITLRTGQPQINRVMGITELQKETIWISVNTEPMLHAGDAKPYSVVVTFRDITQQKHTADALWESEERLRQREKLESIGQLAGGIAHDFNNQLAGIMGYTEILKLKLKSDKKMTRYIENILTAVTRSADLTKQLLAFARRGKYRSVPVDLNEVIEEVSMLLKHSIDKRIKIRQNLNAQDAITIGDPSQLQSALLNIALNARDAMPTGGVLKFETDEIELEEAFCLNSDFDISTGKYIQVDVIDTGTGMDAETQERMFQPFFTTKTPGKGTGMGLAAVYGTIKEHKGAIDVDSRVGKGTRFTVYLQKGKIPRIELKTEIPEITEHKNASIMVVEDEQVVREMITEGLEGLGYSIVNFKNGLEAVNFYRRAWQRIDLVVLDMVMPEMNGRETFESLRETNKDAKVLILSGYAMNGDARHILENGGVGFMQKPFRMSQLARRVKEALNVDKKTATNFK